MRRSIAMLLYLVAELLALAGCCMPRRGYSVSRYEPCSSPSASLAQLASTERQPWQSDVQVPRHDLDDERDYHALDAQRCRCRAVEASQIGNLLDEQRRHLDWMLRAECPEDRAILDLLGDAAREARNRSAASALTLYYTIAELEARRDLSEHAATILDEALADATTVRGRGLPLAADDSQWERDRLELRNKQLELDIALIRANQELKSLLDYAEVSITERIWPDTDLKLFDSRIDVDSAVQLGLRHRNDLRAIGRLSRCADPRRLDAARQAVAPVHALLATSAATGRCCLSAIIALLHHDKFEAEHRQQQLLELQSQRRLTAESEIRTHAAVIARREQQAAVEHSVVAQWDARIDELVAAQKVGKSNLSEIAQARLKRLEARDQLVRSVVAAKIAYVQLLESQGLLVRCDVPCESVKVDDVDH